MNGRPSRTVALSQSVLVTSPGVMWRREVFYDTSSKFVPCVPLKTAIPFTVSMNRGRRRLSTQSSFRHSRRQSSHNPALPLLTLEQEHPVNPAGMQEHPMNPAEMQEHPVNPAGMQEHPMNHARMQEL